MTAIPEIKCTHSASTPHLSSPPKQGSRKIADEDGGAFCCNEISITIPSGSQDENPICVYGPKIHIIAEPNSKCQIIERHLSPALGTDCEVQMVLQDGAIVEHIRLVDEPNEVQHLGRITISVGKNAHYRFLGFSLGGKSITTEIAVKLEGKGAECALSGLDLGIGSQAVDLQVSVEHIAPNTKSSQIFKGIFSDESKGSFYGRVIVRSGADKSDATQMSRNLLLSGSAVVNARPTLEVYTDDVARCKHGATVGQLDEAIIFYCKTRGIPEADAKKMLMVAFAEEIVAGVSDEKLKELVTQRVENVA